MKVKFEKILELNDAINSILANPKFTNTKFNFGCGKFARKNINVILKEFNEEVSDIRLENALTDSTTQALLLNEERDYTYSKEGMKKLVSDRKKLNEKWDKKEFEIEPYMISDLPTLTEYQQELFEGILFKAKK